MNALASYKELIGWSFGHVNDADMFLLQSVVTCGALFWLLHRAWLTLWKPVPELISILGVDVPDPPEVSLAGIKADAVTLHWTRPGVNKPVLKYLIQVNGVNVGESSRLETAITVTGLKPGHFYNVRVIAVGNNNFQAGGRVIRLRTYGRDGRPELGNGRMPSNLSLEDLQNGTVIDSSDESAGVRSHGVGIEAAAVPDSAPQMTREPSGSHLGQRRNTGGRKHSPSTASEHASQLHNVAGHYPGQSMQQLTERFESIRSETEEVITQVARDAEEFKAQMAELLKERDEKRQILKEKEEASEKLKKEVHTSERSNRQAQTRKQQKEKALRERQAERVKMQEDLSRWRNEIESMRKEKEEWDKEEEQMAEETEKKTEELRNILRKRQNSLNAMEEEIRVKGLQIKELEEERSKLAGPEDDEESKALDAAEKQRDIQWDQKERELMTRYNNQTIVFRNLEADLHKAQAFYAQVSARQANNPLLFQGTSSGVDLEPTGQGRTKSRRNRQRKSRTSTISSPIAAYPITDSPFPSASAYNNIGSANSPSFAQGPYFDLSADSSAAQASENTGLSEADIRALTAGAPLSPTATSLLPSNIFADDEPPSPPSRTLGPSLFSSISPPDFENDRQSPESSSRSASLLSSPQTSSHNLPTFRTSRESVNDSERHSGQSPGADFGVIGSPSSSSNSQPTPSKRFGDLFTFPRQRGKTMPDDGLALGSLKTGQSQSFPRQTEEGEAAAIRNRRTSFSSGWGGLSFLNRSGAGSDIPEGNGPAPLRSIARRRRGFNMFGSNIDDPNAVYSDRNPSSPRPASIASSDLPRPSTDSAPFGWPAADSGVINRNSPLATNWSLNIGQQPWSRNPSRRPSIQQSSSTALPISIASDDDEFLPAETLSQQASPPPVGVIGTRPLSSQKSNAPKLNPNAPTFKAMFSRSAKGDKSDRSDKSNRKSKKQDISEAGEENGGPTLEESSPSDSRISRDTYSIHTQTSVSESHESLDRTVSNTPSELITSTTSTSTGKDSKENSFQKLLRKGSSSKFSISSFRGKDSLFGGKKGNSERTASGDRSSSFGDLEEGSEDGSGIIGRSVDSATSSPQVGTSTPKEGRMSVNWSRFSIKKGKGRRESLEADREKASEKASETEGTEDDERDG